MVKLIKVLTNIVWERNIKILDSQSLYYNVTYKENISSYQFLILICYTVPFNRWNLSNFSFFIVVLVFNLYFYFILLYNTVLVLPYIDMNPPRVYMNSPSWTPSHLPPHIISLDHPHAPAPSILYPISNIDWRFVSYLIVYMFQCCSPKSSHPLPLPHSPKVCSIHLCLFCCLAYRVIITIFLNSIYMC